MAPPAQIEDGSFNLSNLSIENQIKVLRLEVEFQQEQDFGPHLSGFSFPVDLPMATGDVLLSGSPAEAFDQFMAGFLNTPDMSDLVQDLNASAQFSGDPVGALDQSGDNSNLPV